MDYQNKSKEELIKELQSLEHDYNQLKEANENANAALSAITKTIRESDINFKKIFEEGPLAIAIVNGEGRFMTVNNAFCRMLNYSEVEFVKFTFKDITHPDDIQSDIINIQKLMKGEIPVYKTEKRYIRKDGDVIWGALTVSANFDEEGQYLYNLAIIEEITGRKRTEDSLREMTERLELATRAAKIGIWDWDISTGKLVWDKQMYSLYGYKETSEKTSTIWKNGLHPDDKEYTDRVLTLATGEGSDYDTEFRIIWPDNSLHWLKAVGQVFYDKENKPVRMVGLNYDITEQKNATEALAASKAKLDAALESMTDAVFISDKEGHFLEFNEAFAAFHKFKNKDECSKTFSEYPAFLDVFMSDGEKAPVEEWAVCRALRGEVGKNVEYKLKRKDTGEEWQGSYSYAPIRDKNNNIVGSVVAGRDITEKKKTEEELVKSRDLLLNLARLVPGVIYQYRLFPDGKSAFPYSSPGMYNIYEVSPEDVQHDASIVFGRLHPEDYDHVTNLIFQSAETLQTFYCEFRVILPKQGLRWRWSQAHPERMKDGSVLWHGIISDITERKQSEILLKEKSDEIETQNREYQQLNEELRQTNEELQEAKELAEQSDRLKTAFLQNMSHEIRTPMNAIMGFSELLAEQYNNKQKLEQYSGIITQRCSDLLNIINEILDVAKIESGQLPVYMEECKLTSLFSDLFSFFTEYQARQRKQHITFEMQPLNDLPNLVIRTDKVKLKQIFINLIGNAFKFTDRGSIKAGCIMDDNNQIVFFVSDTGIGIPHDKKDFIFKRFAQLESTPGRIYGGTGLGLSIVKGLIEMLNGKIWLETEFSKGTTFYFSLPYEIQNNTVHQCLLSEEALHHDFSNKTILIVEDDNYNAEYLIESLNGTGIRIFHSIYGNDAVNILKNQKIDLVLMDIRLPDMDGYTATRLIRKTNPELRIIAQTAYAAPEDKERALNAGCNDYISKPVKKDTLLSMVNKQLTKY